MKKSIEYILKDSIEVKKAVLANKDILRKIEDIVTQVIATFKKGNKVLFCGNGGSASDAQHLAAELSGRFFLDRAPLFAEALHVNSSFITAVANDYGFDEIYARALRAVGKKGDLLFALSTSGNSENVLKAIKTAKDLEILVVGFTGQNGGKMADACDLLIKIPSEITPRIQESHITIGHIICEIVERELFPNA